MPVKAEGAEDSFQEGREGSGRVLQERVEQGQAPQEVVDRC